MRMHIMTAAICLLVGFLISSSFSQDDRKQPAPEIGRYQISSARNGDILVIMDTTTARFWMLPATGRGEWLEQPGPVAERKAVKPPATKAE